MASDSLIFPVYEGKTFYNDGKIKAIYEYINLNGQIWHGKYKKYYHKNGSINTKGDYFFNRRVGIWKYFNNTGQVIKEVFYGKNLDDTSTVHKNTNTIHKNSVNIQKALDRKSVV